VTAATLAHSTVTARSCNPDLCCWAVSNSALLMLLGGLHTGCWWACTAALDCSTAWLIGWRALHAVLLLPEFLARHLPSSLWHPAQHWPAAKPPAKLQEHRITLRGAFHSV
jgi:hypothetical protein